MAIVHNNTHIKQQVIHQIRETGSLIIEKHVIKEIVVEIPTVVIKNIYIARDSDDVITEDKIVYVPQYITNTVEVLTPYNVHKEQEINKRNIAIGCLSVIILCMAIYIGAN